MARAPRDPRLSVDRPGERPLLQGFLRHGARPDPRRAGPVEDETAPEVTDVAEDRSVQPAAEGAEGAKAAKRGKATRSPAEVAKRRNLEGSEQGPA